MVLKDHSFNTKAQSARPMIIYWKKENEQRHARKGPMTSRELIVEEKMRDKTTPCQCSVTEQQNEETDRSLIMLTSFLNPPALRTSRY
jgi:hypothetical protein